MRLMLALMGIAGASLLASPAAFSQPAPGETGQDGLNRISTTLPGEAGDVISEIGETGGFQTLTAQIDPGESGPPPVFPQR